MIKTCFRVEPFPIDMENARNLPMQQLAETFIPTTLFWELLTVGHRILLGSRGQGKTALFRMLAFEGLSELAKFNSRARQKVEDNSFIGIYLPTKLEWVQSLSLQSGRKGIDETEAFLWKFNHSSCVAFLQSAKAYINYFAHSPNEAVILEQRFCKDLSDVWKLGHEESAIENVIMRLKRIGYEWQVRSASLLMGDKNRVTKNSAGCVDAFNVFELEALAPLRIGMDTLSTIMRIPSETSWLLCIDEAEYMTKAQQRILNSLMRLAPGNLFLKIATMPYGHYTLETDNVSAPVTPGHDFEYLHMEEGWGVLEGEKECVDSVDDFDASRQEFGELLFQKVIKRYLVDNGNSKNSLEKFFGSCELLDPQKDADWTESSHNMQLLRKYGTSELIARAGKIQSRRDKEKFMNEVGRKIRGALVLREDLDSRKGHSKSGIYSGASMIVKCADGNPRLLIRILSRIFAGKKIQTKRKIPSVRQDEVLTILGKNFLNQIRSYQNVGLKLFENVRIAGHYMASELYDKPISSDCVFSIRIPEPRADDLARRELIKSAIKYGVIKPNDISKINYGAEATLEGLYHLSYIFCPLFRIQPRVGKAVSFQTMEQRINIKNKSLKRKKGINANVQMTFDLFGGRS